MIRGTTLLSLLIGGLLAVFVFAVKYEVQDLEAELNALNRSISKERRAIHVLIAEWSYLNEPGRLARLADQHLGLQPIEPQQVRSFDGLLPRDAMPPGETDGDRMAILEAAVRRLLEEGVSQ